MSDIAGQTAVTEVDGRGEPASAEERGSSAHRSRLRRFMRNRTSVIGLAVLILVVLASLLAPFLTSHSPTVGNLLRPLEGPSAEHWLGTDQLGRDTFARVLYGGRVALLAGLIATVVALTIGLPLGLVVGYAGGAIDNLFMRLVDAIVSLPFLVIAIGAISAFGPGIHKSMIVVGVIYSMSVVRLARGEVLATKEELFIDGARVAGFATRRILLRHILPNILPSLIVQVTLMFGTAVVVEAILSYLGLGITPPAASWGSMLADAQSQVRSSAFLGVPPGVAIVVTVLAFNLVGDGLRDVFAREVTGNVLETNRPQRSEPINSPAEPADSDAPLSVRSLSVSFRADGKDVAVVQNVDLQVRRHEILGLVGESGSGKSMTAMAMLALVPQPGVVTAASIRMGGTEIVGCDQRTLRRVRGRDVGMIFQEPIACLNPAYTVGEQIAERLREHAGLDRSSARRRSVELLKMVHIPEAEQRSRSYPHQFSGGMAQRVMIAMALACEPRVLIADEPTTALDVTVARQILDLLVELRDRTGTAIVLISHDLASVASVADRVAIMYAGQIVETGEVDDVFDRPQHPYTIGLLASRPRNEARSGPLTAIPGRVPPPSKWPSSCHFADRCRHAAPICREAPVELVGRGSASVRCVRASEFDSAISIGTERA